MHSAVYLGRLRHRRLAPRAHEFSYRLFMIYMDLAELDRIFRHRWLWSTRRPALAWLRRADYLGDPKTSLDAAVRDRVQAETGSRPCGPIRMLTHLRYFGVGFNPVTFYYCFDRDDRRVDTIVAEITNTPWKERHAYVLSGRVNSSAAPSHDGEEDKQIRHLHFSFQKAFHVSPFMPMQLVYDWRFSLPGARLTVHMQNFQGDSKIFDATLDLTRRPICAAELAKALFAFPPMTIKVIVGIYWQAFKLWLKRVAVHTHPRKSSDHERHAQSSSIS